MVMRETNGAVNSLDFRETAPAAAHRDMYLDSAGNVIDRLSVDGHLAAGVPGSVAGMWDAHQQGGSLPWQDLLEPAIRLAEKGVIITPFQAKKLNHYQEALVKHNAVPEQVPFIKETDWQADDTLFQPMLAQTLIRIRDRGRDGFYTGETARLLVAEMQSGGGIIDTNDLKAYTTRWRKPVSGEYKGFRIIGMPPPSSGGCHLVVTRGRLRSRPEPGWQLQPDR